MNALLEKAVEEETEEDQSLPRPGECVWVACERFRCAGFVDGEGEWRDYYTGESLPQVVQWERF